MTDYQFDPRLAFARTLPSRYYFDKDVLDAENRNVFARTWQLAGHADRVRDPGQFFTTTIANEPVLVVRGSDGVLRAMSNVCRHRAGPVATGEGKRPVLQCGYHGWTYSLDGSLLQTPEMSGVECFERDDFSLPQFRVEIWNELVFVNLGTAAAPLAEFLGDLVARLAPRNYAGYRLAARKEWSLDCNWKVYVDNYLEGYHIPIVHPGLFREIDYPNYRTETKANYSIQVAPLKRPDRIRVNEAGGDIDYFWIWPNLMLNVYPDNFSTNLIIPVSPTETITVFEWFFENQSDPGVRKLLADTVAFSDEIQLEDIAICETVQKNLSSSTYSQGRYSVARENGVHHFHGMLAQAVDSPSS
jgi:choline monooxygenase